MSNSEGYKARFKNIKITKEGDYERAEVELSPLEALIFNLELMLPGLPDHKQKALQKNIDFIRDRLTSLKINSGEGLEYTLNYTYRLEEGEDPKSIEKKLNSYLNTNAVHFSIQTLLGKTREYLSFLGEREKELEKREKELSRREKRLGKYRKHTQIAIHTVTQFFGDNTQLSLFSDEKVDAFSRATGLSITNRPDSYGVVLNQSQRRVLEGILKAFSESNYKGIEEVDKYKSLQDVMNTGSGAMREAIKKPYQNIDKIPVIRLTQSEIIELSGHDRTQGDKTDVVDAISFLATKQFCFYWVRLKTENGKPVKDDKSGAYVKEEVMEVGTLFRIKTVRTEEGELQYYEIHPSAPLLDQVSNYFLLVPNNWRDEVKQLTGKRASSYTYELLLWLRLQYEQIRRYNKGGGKNRKPKPFKLSKTWEEVAIALKMPESMYKANRKRAAKIIQEAYSVAIKLGYLLKVENTGATDILYLNEKYYPKPGQLI